MTPKSLIDKIALVAGGSGALGSVIAERLSAEGCSVYITYRQKKGAPTPRAGIRSSVRALSADLTDEGQATVLFDHIIAESSRIDIVVNTVGGYVGGKNLKDVSVQDWDLMMNANLKSAFLLTREALRRMDGQLYGRIINISAMAGLNLTPGRAPYALSKAAVALLTEIVSKEIKGSGITINAIAPSIIVTASNLESLPDADTTKWVTPDQIAELVCYFCSPAAAAISGTTVKAYGGV